MKTVLITGGAGGLGLATATHLCDQGWDVATLDTLPLSPTWHHVQADVTDPVGLKQAFDQVEKVLGAINCMVCFHGFVSDGSMVKVAPGQFSRYSLDDWNKTVAVNLTGTFLCLQEFLERRIRVRGKGVAITCSSPAADGAPGQAAYGASKAGVEALTVAAAREAAPWGVRICGLRPALTDTPMAQKYDARIHRELIGKSLLRRFATAQEVALGVEFLLSSELVSGRIMKFDGGIEI